LIVTPASVRQRSSTLFLQSTRPPAAAGPIMSMSAADYGSPPATPRRRVAATWVVAGCPWRSPRQPVALVCNSWLESSGVLNGRVGRGSVAATVRGADRNVACDLQLSLVPDL